MKDKKKAIFTLRKSMLENNIKACIIPSNDPHASEYTATHWKAREFFSGFKGSAGTLVVTTSSAGLWTDSRYFLQAERELKGTEITLFKEGEEDCPEIIEWLCKNVSRNEIISIYKELFSIQNMRDIYESLRKVGIAINTDIDLISPNWQERPPISKSPIFIHEEKYAGKSVAEKLQMIRLEMNTQRTDILLLNSLDEIAWAFNIRANDTEYNPIAIAYAAIENDCAHIFVNLNKIKTSLQKQFESLNIKFHDYNSTTCFLRKLKDKTIWMDASKMNYALYEYASEHNNIKLAPSPIIHFKSCKNRIEIAGIKEAMIKDGVALTQFFIWFENCLKTDTNISELLVGEKLKEFRAKQDLFFGESFAPIVGYREHAAIVHYSANNESDTQINKDGFLLIDSGAQYLHGTTDITRTIYIGQPNPQATKDFTLVLKGHIALVQAKFPAGTCGYQLDSLARQFLWKEGLNYGHGTGHGVGCFSCVHEGPQGIRPDTNKTALKPGMVISNEPGLYRTNEYGIRIENLILVCEIKNVEKGDFFYFETLTLFPLEKKLIDTNLLSTEEITWINDYHKLVYKKLSANLNTKEQNWLAEKCLAI